MQAPPSGGSLPPQQAPPPKRKPPRRKPPKKPAAQKKPPAQQQPQPGQQPLPQPPAPPPPATPPPVALTQAQVIAAIIAALSAALTAAGLAAALAKTLKVAGIGYLALRAVCILMMSWPQDVLEGTGPAQRYMVRQNTLRRAQFMWAACKRVQSAVVTARSHGQPVRQAIRDALATEKRYMAQHVAASNQRIAASSAVDGAAEAYGNLLGWNAFIDARTSAGCRAASGKNFYADRPPVVEGAPSLPGAVHPSCRCWPSAPFKGAPVLP